MKISVAAAMVLCLQTSIAVVARELKPFTGDPLPPSLALEDLAGRTHTLTDYRGQVVLINFWTTWCPPCIEEMPALQRLKQRMTDRPFQILAVNVKEPKKLSVEFLRRFAADFTVLLDPEGTTVRRWRVYVFPASFLIDPNGRIRFAYHGALEWDKGEALRTIERLMPDGDGR